MLVSTVMCLQYQAPIVVTGDVVPVGGTRVGHHSQVPIIPGELFMEPMSSKPVRVGGAYLKDGEVLPCSGSQQALLDATTLASEARVQDSLRAYREAVTGRWCSYSHILFSSQSSFFLYKLSVISFISH